MLSNEPTLRPGLFRLPDQPVASSILIPSFRAAKRVRGAFGWFSAGWIERLAPGLAEYLNRIDTDPIDFTVAPAWFAQERTAAERGVRMTAQEAAELIVDVFVKGRADASALSRHALDCLAWMIATQDPAPANRSPPHPTRTTTRRSGSSRTASIASSLEGPAMRPTAEWPVELSISTSTYRGCPRASPGSGTVWPCSTTGQEAPVAGSRRWLSCRRRWRETSSVQHHKRYPNPTTTQRRRRAMAPNGRQQHLGSGGYRSPNISCGGPARTLTKSEAVTSWEAGETPETGVIAMATGAGKTLTALICATRSQERLNGKPFLIVVSAPSIPLIMQWRDEVKKFGVNPVAPSLESDTNKALTPQRSPHVFY